jgi:hypothetical protein
MSPIENLKTRLIDRILCTENEQLLEEVDSLLSSSSEPDVYKLDTYQLEILDMSQRDIQQGNVISESEVAKIDEQWMK